MVAAGDTLYNIGVRYGGTPREIAALNGISDPTTISIGTELRIPQTEPAETTVMGETIEMVPAAGETVTATTTAPQRVRRLKLPSALRRRMKPRRAKLKPRERCVKPPPAVKFSSRGLCPER